MSGPKPVWLEASLCANMLILQPLPPLFFQTCYVKDAVYAT